MSSTKGPNSSPLSPDRRRLWNFAQKAIRMGRATGRSEYDLASLQPRDLLRFHPQQFLQDFSAILADSRCTAIVGFDGAELHRQARHGARTGIAMLPRNHQLRRAKRLVGRQLEGIVHRSGCRSEEA